MDEGRPTDALDGLLVRYLDGEAEPSEVERIESSPSDSPEVRRLAELEAADATVDVRLAALPSPVLPPLRRKRRPRWVGRAAAAAAAVLILAGALTAARPVRTAMVEGARWLAAWVADPVVPSPTPGRAVIGMAVNGPELAVEVIGTPGASVLRLEVGASPDVRAAAGAAELTVMSDRLRIRTEPGQADTVVVTVPLAVRHVRVDVYGRVQTFDLAAESRPEPIRLGPGG